MPAAACRTAPEAAEGPELEEPTAPFTAAAAIFRDAANRRPNLLQRRLQTLARRKCGREVEPKAGGVAMAACLRPPRLELSLSPGGAFGARPLMNMSVGAPPAVSQDGDRKSPPALTESGCGRNSSPLPVINMVALASAWAFGMLGFCLGDANFAATSRSQEVAVMEPFGQLCYSFRFINRL